MYIDLKKTLSQIENALPQGGVQDVIKLQKAYELTLCLRSQIIGVIYDMKQYRGAAENNSPMCYLYRSLPSYNFLNVSAPLSTGASLSSSKSSLSQRYSTST